jgi:putative membrane protein
MGLFSSAELTNIEAQIAEVEARTSAEIVVMTVQRSDAYHDVRLALSFVLGLLIASVVHLLFPGLDASWLLLTQLAGTFVSWPLSGASSLLRAVLPAARAHEAVERAAQLGFLQHEVFATRDRNGVLILLSELEHRVALLGDSALHAHLQSAGFAELVERLTQAIREGRAGVGTCDVIARLGAALSTVSPVKADNPDELDNRVRQG